MSCTGTADEKVCDYFDFILNPGMQQLQSYLKGTKYFLLWIEKLKLQYPELPPLFSILTMDFKQMYPSMPDDLVMPAVRDYLNSRQDKSPSTAKTMELLEIIRNNNFMEFGDKMLQQVGGTSIGKKHAPPLACFIITHNPHNPPLSKWLQETFLILQADSKMRQIYQTPPSVSFRQGRNLKQVLVRNRFKELPFQDGSDIPAPGCFRYEHGNRGRACMICPKLSVSRRFKSTFTGLSYNIRHHLNCQSCYVVYLVTCWACQVQYVGKTTEAMHKRHTGHRREIEDESTPLGRQVWL